MSSKKNAAAKPSSNPSKPANKADENPGGNRYKGPMPKPATPEAAAPAPAAAPQS